jgi:hypothetical protein
MRKLILSFILFIVSFLIFSEIGCSSGSNKIPFSSKKLLLALNNEKGEYDLQNDAKIFIMNIPSNEIYPIDGEGRSLQNNKVKFNLIGNKIFFINGKKLDIYDLISGSKEERELKYKGYFLNVLSDDELLYTSYLDFIKYNISKNNSNCLDIINDIGPITRLYLSRKTNKIVFLFQSMKQKYKAGSYYSYDITNKNMVQLEGIIEYNINDFSENGQYLILGKYNKIYLYNIENHQNLELDSTLFNNTNNGSLFWDSKHIISVNKNGDSKWNYFIYDLDTKKDSVIFTSNKEYYLLDICNR